MWTTCRWLWEELQKAASTPVLCISFTFEWSPPQMAPHEVWKLCFISQHVGASSSSLKLALSALPFSASILLQSFSTHTLTGISRKLLAHISRFPSKKTEKVLKGKKKIRSCFVLTFTGSDRLCCCLFSCTYLKSSFRALRHTSTHWKSVSICLHVLFFLSGSPEIYWRQIWYQISRRTAAAICLVLTMRILMINEDVSTHSKGATGF